MSNNNNNTENLSFRGIIKTGPSKILVKTNGSKYCLQNVEIQNGPFTGKVVGAERTLLNVNKEEKAPLNIGEKCLVYVTQLPSTTNPGKMQFFFTIGEENGASQDELNDLWNNYSGQEEKVEEDVLSEFGTK